MINSERLQRLEALQYQGSQLEQVIALIQAFCFPMLEYSQKSDGWKNYFRLIAQLNTNRSTVLLLIAEFFNPIALQFMTAIRKTLPELDERQTYIAYQLMVASVMSIFSDNYRLNIMSDNVYHSSDYQQHYKDLIRFIAYGMIGIKTS